MCASYWIKRIEDQFAALAAMQEWLETEFRDTFWENSDFKKRGQEFAFPGYDVPVVTLENATYVYSEFRWGFIPKWAKDANHKPAPFNARSETVNTSAMFKEAFRNRRCLIPALGFTEWREENGKKIRYQFTPESESFLCFAGIWNEWAGPLHSTNSGSKTLFDQASFATLRSCTILTSSPNSSVEPFHDRMPVCLTRESAIQWIRETSEETDLKPLMSPREFQLIAKPMK
jgi:putative SOS response-associated peptidase YedK